MPPGVLPPRYPEQTLDAEEIPQAAFGLVLDPFQPSQVMPPPGLASRPPQCPIDGCLMYAVRANVSGDMLLACNACGYEAVWRAGRGFEPLPHCRDASGRPVPWAAREPFRCSCGAVAQMPDGKPFNPREQMLPGSQDWQPPTIGPKPEPEVAKATALGRPKGKRTGSSRRKRR